MKAGQSSKSTTNIRSTNKRELSALLDRERSQDHQSLPLPTRLDHEQTHDIVEPSSSGKENMTVHDGIELELARGVDNRHSKNRDI